MEKIKQMVPPTIRKPFNVSGSNNSFVYIEKCRKFVLHYGKGKKLDIFEDAETSSSSSSSSLSSESSCDQGASAGKTLNSNGATKASSEPVKGTHVYGACLSKEPVPSIKNVWGNGARKAVDPYNPHNPYNHTIHPNKTSERAKVTNGGGLRDCRQSKEDFNDDLWSDWPIELDDSGNDDPWDNYVKTKDQVSVIKDSWGECASKSFTAKGPTKSSVPSRVIYRCESYQAKEPAPSIKNVWGNAARKAVEPYDSTKASEPAKVTNGGLRDCRQTNYRTGLVRVDNNLSLKEPDTEVDDLRRENAQSKGQSAFHPVRYNQWN